MGSSLGQGRRDTRRYRKQRFTEINVTPMVDVMLVLLIIFMVTAPMLTAGVQVDLPEAKATPLQGKDEPLTISVQADGKIFIQKTPVSIDELGDKLRAIAGEKSDTRIFVRGDRNVDYGRIMRAIGEITAAGFNKVALITEQVQGNSSRKGK
jgi:biopolymer transport protein TolR